MKISQLKYFLKYLEAAGVEMLAPTNAFELVRFKANGRVGLIYKNGNGDISSIMGEAIVAVNCFLNRKPYCARDPKRRINRNQVLNTLLQRDGVNCFYCGLEMAEGDETVEHLLPINKGGSNHPANLVLCHFECNKMAGHLDIIKKIELRDELRLKNRLEKQDE